LFSADYHLADGIATRYELTDRLLNPGEGRDVLCPFGPVPRPNQPPVLWVQKVKQSRYRPGVAQRVPEVTVPRFLDNGTGWW
jgi:hypothetical protein